MGSGWGREEVNRSQEGGGRSQEEGGRSQEGGDKESGRRWKETGRRWKEAGKSRWRDRDGELVINSDHMVHRGGKNVMGATGKQERFADFWVAVLDRTDFSCK